MVVPVMIKDAGGATVIKSVNARIRRAPDHERGKDVGTVEWALECGRLETFIGGNAGGTYDPLLYAMVVGSIPITGLAEGTFLKVKRNVDNFTRYTGTDGETSWARQHDKSGEISFVLKQTSECNDALSALMALDEIPAAV
jgi:hypothetical protein